MSSPTRWTGGVAPLWSVTPPPPKIRKYDRLPVPPGPGVSVLIVSAQIEEMRTHYIDARTVPCTGDDGQCWLDHRLVGSPRYCGWLAVALPTAAKVWLLSLTKVTVAVEPRLRQQGFDLSGLAMKVWRAGNHERSELHAALCLGMPRALKVPVCPDVRCCVERMLAGQDRPKVPNGSGPGIMSRAFAAQKGGQS